MLNDAGAQKLPHKQIAQLLHEQHGSSEWWSQMITVEYERAHGLREIHQKSDGQYAAGKSKTFVVPVERLYTAWADAEQRGCWLSEAGAMVRRATPAKSVRIVWPDGTEVEAAFYAKGDQKSQLAVTHSKLASAADVAMRKQFWAGALDRLSRYLTQR